MRNRNSHPLFHRDPGSAGELRLDAAESNWLRDELRWVDTETYKQDYANMMGVALVPSGKNIPPWARSHMWREMDAVGRAEVITSAGQNLPRTDVFRKEHERAIKIIGGSYGYTWDEMQAAAAVPGSRLDTERAIANREALEEKRDEIMAYGLSSHGLEGLLTLTGISTFTLADKAKGGKTWGTLVAPNATGKEVAYDLMAFAESIVTASLGKIQSVDIVLTIEAYSYAAQKEMSGTDSTKALTAALASSFINSITPWWRCSASRSGGKLANDTMIGYPKNPRYIFGVNPLEYTPQPAQQVDLEWKIPALMKTGGVVCRYTHLVAKATGFGA